MSQWLDNEGESAILGDFRRIYHPSDTCNDMNSQINLNNRNIVTLRAMNIGDQVEADYYQPFAECWVP